MKPIIEAVLSLIFVGIIITTWMHPSDKPEAAQTNKDDFEAGFRNRHAISEGQDRARVIHRMGGSFMDSDQITADLESSARASGARNRAEIDEFVSIAEGAMRDELNLLEAGK